MKPSRFPLGPGECFSFALRRAARTVSRQYDEALAPLRLNNGQFSMLALLAELGPLRIQKVAETLAMDRTTVTAALKPLQRRKLVRVDVAGDDARAREAVLTPAGEELAPLIDSLAIWGQHWARDMCFDDLDPGFLAWSMHMSLDTARMPAGRTRVRP